jgi:enoyl-[acyl-carrier protein] reductase III
MNHEAARRTVEELQACGTAASAFATDVGKEELLREMFAHVDAQFGRLDVFVSNAARTAFQPARTLTARSWRKTLEINAQAFLLGSQMAADIMSRHGGGRIVGLSSLGSRYYTPNYAGLGAAKAAIENLARYLAVELAPSGINVNVVCGGFVDSDSMRMLPDYATVVDHVVARTPAARLATPDDLARVVAFLCAPESDWIRGQTIVADGGYSLLA